MDTGRFEDDAVLIRACGEGDDAAWDFFVKKYSGHILNSIACRLRKYGINLKAEDLKEIRQGTLSLLWERGKFAEIRNPASIKYWLSMVAGNEALQYMRRRKRLDRLAPVSLAEKIDGVELVEMVASGASPAPDEMDRSELAGRLEEAVESLPLKEKLAMKLNLLHDKKYAEISEIMGMPQGTVSSCIKRAKERIRQKLRDYA